MLSSEKFSAQRPVDSPGRDDSINLLRHFFYGEVSASWLVVLNSGLVGFHFSSEAVLICHVFHPTV